MKSKNFKRLPDNIVDVCAYERIHWKNGKGLKKTNAVILIFYSKVLNCVESLNEHTNY